MNALDIRHITKVFSNGVKALDEVSFALPSKSIGALIGPSGSGKTTLLRCVAGLEQADGGTIAIQSKPVFDKQTSINPSDRQVGFLFQDYALFPHLTVEQNVRFGISKLSKQVQNERIHKYLSLCSVEHLTHRYPHQLSGGQQQRVALARALAAEPTLLLLDEPFSNVDETLKQQMRLDMAEVIHQCGISALMVVHDVKDAFAIASHIGVLADGKLHQSGSPAELYRHPKTAEVARVTGEVNVLHGTTKQDGFECVLGTLAHAHGQAAGKEIELMLRPEHLTLKSNGEWKVSSVLFAGASRSVRCRKGMHSIDVRVEINAGISVGDLVGIELNLGHSELCWVRR